MSKNTDVSRAAYHMIKFARPVFAHCRQSKVEVQKACEQGYANHQITHNLKFTLMV